VNKSQVLRLDVPFNEVLVGNPEIADVLPLTDRTVYVLGKSLGSTSLTIYGRGKSLIAVVDLVVSRDIDGLKAQLHELMPNERIEVRAANGSLVLSGTVSSPSRVARALAVAERYAPENVTNLLGVKGSQQVMLAVRFAEVQRTVMKELGINTNIVDDDIPFSLASFDSGRIASLSALFTPTSAATAMTGFTAGSFAVDFLFDALEKKGVVKTLAEPNLIALSGDTASFLAGGEFPIPVSRNTQSGGDTITIEFKEFGISLAFTPTVLEDGLINIVVSPEVSRIDMSNAVQLQGFVVPGLTTRRATTTVELRDGQSFAIAGLLQNDFADTVRQLPGIGDLPIIGALVRSTDYQRNETELVILVTPHLVQPAPAGTLATPADNFVPPSDLGIFLMGYTEGPQPKGARGAHMLSAQSAGGIQGAYGHIIK
jgi:pilus assembly protein CpaC